MDDNYCIWYELYATKIITGEEHCIGRYRSFSVAKKHLLQRNSSSIFDYCIRKVGYRNLGLEVKYFKTFYIF